MFDPYDALRMTEAEFFGGAGLIEPWVMEFRSAVGGDQYSVWMNIDRNELLLVVRGTSNVEGWFSNCRFWPEAGIGDSGRKYPKGFIDGARAIWDDLARHGDRRKITHIAGHSRGAAIGSILAVSLPNVRKAICFATPKCIYGREPFPGGRESRVINYCRPDDLVCHLPFGPRRLGETVWLPMWLTPFEPDHSTEKYRRAMLANGVPIPAKTTESKDASYISV